MGYVPKFVPCPSFTFSYSFYPTGINGIEALEPLRQRYHAQHYSLHKFYSECSNLEYLTGLMNIPKLSPVRHISSSYFLDQFVARRNHPAYFIMKGHLP